MNINYVEYEPTPNFASLGTGDDNLYTNGEFYIAEQLIQRDQVVLDVGANKGGWAKMVLSLAPLARLYCVEPIEEACKHLFTQFHFRQELRIVNGAMSDKVGEAEFFVYKNNPQVSEMSNLFSRPAVEINQGLDVEKRTVRTLTLDHLCKVEKLDHIHYLKLDVEGAEWLALQGAKETLEAGKIDHIQFEYGGCFVDSKATLQDVFRYLGQYGFTVMRVLPNGVLHFTNWSDEMENFAHSNYIAIHNCGLPITQFDKIA